MRVIEPKGFGFVVLMTTVIVALENSSFPACVPDLILLRRVLPFLVVVVMVVLVLVMMKQKSRCFEEEKAGGSVNVTAEMRVALTSLILCVVIFITCGFVHENAVDVLMLVPVQTAVETVVCYCLNTALVS